MSDKLVELIRQFGSAQVRSRQLTFYGMAPAAGAELVRAEQLLVEIWELMESTTQLAAELLLELDGQTQLDTSKQAAELLELTKALGECPAIPEHIDVHQLARWQIEQQRPQERPGAAQVENRQDGPDKPSSAQPGPAGWQQLAFDGLLVAGQQLQLKL